MSEREKEHFAREKEQIATSLFCLKQLERLPHGRSFVKSDGSESLKLLFKKERMSEQ